jgi:outer membrane biosynthesis protein TonB
MIYLVKIQVCDPETHFHCEDSTKNQKRKKKKPKPKPKPLLENENLEREINHSERERERVGINGGGEEREESEQRGEREAVRRSSAEAHDGGTAPRNVQGVRTRRRGQHHQGQGHARLTWFASSITHILESSSPLSVHEFLFRSECVISR